MRLGSSTVFLGSVDTSNNEVQFKIYATQQQYDDRDQLKVWSRTYRFLTSYGLLYQQISKELLEPSDVTNTVAIYGLHQHSSKEFLKPSAGFLAIYGLHQHNSEEFLRPPAGFKHNHNMHNTRSEPLE
jgi:hypothetical protein